MAHTHNCFEEMVINHLKGKHGDALKEEIDHIAL